MLRRLFTQACDAGETLLELVLTVVILGICVVAVGAGLSTTIKISDVHRKQAVAQEFLHNYAETLQTSAYQPCTLSAPNYAAGLPTPPNAGPWSISQASVKYWSGTTFVSTCQSPDNMQQVTLHLRSGGGLVDEYVTVVLRNPS